MTAEQKTERPARQVILLIFESSQKHFACLDLPNRSNHLDHPSWTDGGSEFIGYACRAHQSAVHKNVMPQARDTNAMPNATTKQTLIPAAMEACIV